jgi:hypothetical protein
VFRARQTQVDADESDDRPRHGEAQDERQLHHAWGLVVELACRLPLDVPVDEMLRLAKVVLGLQGAQDGARYKRAVDEYDACLTTYLRESTCKLQRAIDDSIASPQLTWLGTVSFFSRIKPNEISGKGPPCRITYFHNSEKKGGNGFRLPICFEKATGGTKVQFKVSRTDKENEPNAEQGFQDLLNWMKCPPANLVSYFGSSISISCVEYFKRLWSQTVADLTSRDPEALLARVADQFALYVELRDLTEHYVCELKNVRDDKGRQTTLRREYGRAVDLKLETKGLDRRKLKDARDYAIEEIRFHGVRLASSNFLRTICRAGQCDWSNIDKMIEDLEPVDKGWGYEVMLEPLFAIAAAGGRRLNVYFSGLKPTLDDYHKSEERTLCGLVAMALYRENAERFQNHGQFHQMLSLFSRAVMTPLAHIESLAITDHAQGR